MDTGTASEATTATGSQHVVVLGAGPAGLTAAWRLSRDDVAVEVLEADPRKVGGISRTEEYKGFRFDIGGHRFFSKSPEVEKLWRDILPPTEWLSVRRMSRIYYRRRFFDYPIKAVDTLRKLGVGTSVLCVLSYLRARAFPRREVRNFEDWIVNNFGLRLYRIFFKTYTEKVWGRPCTEISADWAAQRIKGLSLLSAVRHALPRRQRAGSAVIKTLIEVFAYPRQGPGQMWEHAAEQIRSAGGAVTLGTRVVEVHHAGDRVTHVVAEDAAGRREVAGTDFIATLPLRELVSAMRPAAPPHVREAAAALDYRDYLTVVLVVDRPDVFPDNWIYIHEPEVLLGRIQNYKNWSPDMVPDSSQTALGLEYFTTEGDVHLWEQDDEALIRLGIRECAQIGLVDPAEVQDATVVRMPKAYPVYDDSYAMNVGVIRGWLDAVATNLQTVGRNGMHKYNNQDHSMMSALLAARNLLGEDWDPWKVNTDAEYHEEVVAGADQAGRRIPGRAAPVPHRS
ncbi:NAD(P)/FAD-dependent oxidoreductase [Modestobacter sp. VKM Ac-2985]|uniref:NAD(P)/FAD-dependent oxidoreductase n=1 Tax=Modestobacter sp. VKM Ac-2985 TaxID=3004139 RepID=UPI0022AB9C4E|nr:NAD(P)/FAD-dependent oxidoreductase [Modestobacter sp. VKM Ac-2985]MCZ2837709.1 NAD(P)/FAD-dependent oxidoreductase [Modestobacter sp. VKM Ac-2985]